MEFGSFDSRRTKGIRDDAGIRTAADYTRVWKACRTQAGEEGTMQAASAERHDVAAAHPISELLACPPAVGNLLNASAECIEFDAGDVIFHQNEICRGLYVVIAGQLLRKTARLDTRLTLGPVRAGEVVELAAMLSDARHTYTLIAQSEGTVMRLPKEALSRAFQSYAPLRMQLLEELAREVSRAYGICCATRMTGIRRKAPGSASA